MNKDQELTTSLISQENNNRLSNEIVQNEQGASLPVINGTNIFSALIFAWLRPFMKDSFKNGVTTDKMPTLPPPLQTKTQYQKLINNWNMIPPAQKKGYRLIKAIIKTYQKELISLFFVIFLQTLFTIVNPLITATNIRYIQQYKDDTWYGVQLFILTLMSSVIHKLIFNQFLYRFGVFGINLKNNLNMMIYAKSLNYSTLANKEISQAEIINYSEVDAERMTLIGYTMSCLVYGPIQILFGLIMIYFYVGSVFLAGIGVIIVLLIISFNLSKKVNACNDLILQAKDERMKKTQEMLNIVRFIKISSVQKFFYNKIEEKRLIQMALYVKKGFYNILLMFTFWVTCPLVLSITFILYVKLGNTISSEIAFTVMMLASIIQYPIYRLPTAISECIQVVGSMKRIQNYLDSQEIKSYHMVYQEDSKYAVRIQSGNFYWGKENKAEKKEEGKIDQEDQSQKSVIIRDQIQEQEIKQGEKKQKKKKRKDKQDKKKDNKEHKKTRLLHALKDINLDIQKGKFITIIGDIGSGKSSLLYAILNEMFCKGLTKVYISGQIAYSAQKPWITSQSVKDNITFTLPYDDQKFKKVLYYASLEQDLKILPQAQNTQIGQKGINISGGQKARLSLARALYSQKDIYLLDDILSAVDVHVGEFLARETLKGYLKGKTIIMPTHALKFLQYSDQVIIMHKGKIIRKGPFSQIKETKQYRQIAQKQTQQKQAQQKQKNTNLQIELQAEILNKIIKRKTSADQKQEVAVGGGSEVDLILQRLIIPEDQEKGQLKSFVFKKYIQFGGGYFKFIALAFGSTAFYATFKATASILMQKWCEHPQQDETYLYFYVSSILISSIFILIKSTSILISSTNVSKTIYKYIIKSLIYAGLSDFYNRIPIGRIVNRLTKDLRQLDEDLVEVMNWFVINLFQLAVSLFICMYASSVLAVIPMLLVAYVSFRIRVYYMKTKREVARFQKSTNSPVVSGFMSSISGLASIRAYKVKEQFKENQIAVIDDNKKVRLINGALEGWFGLTLGLMGLFVNMPCIAYCLLGSNENPSLIGLLMVYALTLSDQIIWITLNTSDIQVKFVSVERLLSFMSIQPQSSYKEYCSQTWKAEQQGSKSVIEEGNIEFIDLKARYRAGLPDVIRGITCKINKGEKIGIVGRTGAGKSTIINTLMRVTQISEGQILIDDKSILEYPLKDLRHSLTMIDQEPTLINSTFRQNLDITGKYNDQELRSILIQCNLYDVIESKGGLDAIVSNNSLSAGEKQLLCICRAFLKKSKIVLVDEATANIDVKNDALIQKVIAEKFKDSTVLTIAHRLSTLKSSDKIMVLQKGKLIQFGNPYQLQQKQGGFYAEMIKKDLRELLI